MQKRVSYKGRDYTIDIQWSGSAYCIRCIETNCGFKAIPMDCLDDIEKIKPYIIHAIESRPDLEAIIQWDGKI
jgi:hypothetical protein